MDDLISRQAAIETIDDLYAGKMPFTVTYDAINSAFKALIRMLPSAQPEIIRCKDCKYARLTNDGSCKYCDIWFPDEAEYMDGDYYCASAERKDDE